MGTHCCSTKEQAHNKVSPDQGSNINMNNNVLSNQGRNNYTNNNISLPSKGSSFNKELCKSIANKLPTRTQTDFHSFKDLLRSKTNNLSPIEKSYVIFIWICENIRYDADSYFSGADVDCTPEGVYNNGLSVCSGYSRLFKDFSDYLGLEVECVNCFAKGVGYEPGQMLNKTDHEYNVIKLDNKWYPIDSTWGAGHINKNNRFEKSYNEFYFLANPELLIRTHFPEDEKWQLTKRRYTFQEFLKWPLVKNTFYKYGFESFSPDEGLIHLTNSNEKKFIIYGGNMSTKTILCDVFLLQGNIYQQILEMDNINFYDDRAEIDCIFNKKGKYKVKFFGNNVRGQQDNNDILEYSVVVDRDAKKELSFPQSYMGKEDINIIEPLYNNLRSGQKVKFKIKSNLDEIIIIDGEWHHLKKNPQGFFELEKIIQSQRGQSLVVGKPKPENPNSCDYLVTYNVV